MKRIFGNKIQILLSVLCVCLLGSCSEKEEIGEVRLVDGTKANQTIYADDTSDEGNGIKFSTDGPWTAEVTEDASTRGSDVHWISLSQYGGDQAGDYTITLSVSPNYTGADRTAYIRIYCGTSILTITVLQKATTESGDMPVDIAKTYDGKPAYVKFATAEVMLPVLGQERYAIELQTNMIEPNIRIDLPGVKEEEEYMAAIVDFTLPDVENGGTCQLLLDVFANRSNSERQNILKFLRSDDSVVGSVTLVQPSGATCQLTDKQSTVGSLTFHFKNNEQTKFIRYVFAEERLTENQVNDLMEDWYKSKELQLAEGQTTFDLTFDNLIPATTYYLYLRPLGQNWESVGLDVMEEATTSVQENKHDLVLKVSANPANDFTVYLPFSDDNLKGVINWGDGKTEEVEGWSQQGVSHIYDVTVATTYEVRFKGVLTRLDLIADNRAARENTLLAVTQWGYTGLTDIDLSGFSSLTSIAPDTEGAFRGMKHFGVDPYGGSFTDTNIESIPEGFFDYAINATSFDYTFGDCKKLTSIPAGLFKKCTKAKSFQRTFIGCELIREIPEDIFAGCTGVTNFMTTFNGCKALEAIPANLFANNTEVISFEGTFGRCVSLQTVPANLFANCPKVLYFGMSALRDATYRGGLGVFDGCSALQSIPETLFAGNPLIRDASYAFSDCKLLASIPENLFKQNTGIEHMEATFLNCSALNSIPAGLFDNNRKLMRINELFSGCRNVEGESPYTLVGDKKVKLYERNDYNTEFVAIQYSFRCFEMCTKLTDYDVIPSGWK